MWRREESRGRGWSSRRDQARGLVEKQEARSCGRKRGKEGGPSRRDVGGVEDRSTNLFNDSQHTSLLQFGQTPVHSAYLGAKRM